MFRRPLLIAVFASILLACTAAPALAFGPLWSQPVDGAARLVPGAGGATVVWAADLGGGASALLAAHHTRTGGVLAGGPIVLETGIAGLDGWCAAGDGSHDVTVVWKAGGVTWAKSVQLDGSILYGPVPVCSDAAVAALRGAGATAAPVSVTADGDGGVYVQSAVSPSSGAGDTLLDYVSPLGMLSAADPGLPVPKGTVAALAVDSSAHAYVLLGAPGRKGLAVQRYAPDLTADWDAPISPYNPLLGPPPATAQEPVGLTAATAATVAWREAAKVKVQRFSAEGSQLLLRPAAVTMAGAVELAADGAGGCYLVGPSGSGIVARHLDASGLEIGSPGSILGGLGLSEPRVDALATNRAGDLTAAYSDAASAAVPGVAQLTCLGRWQGAGLTAAPERFSEAAQDGAGGAYVLGAGGAAALLRFAAGGTAITFRPRAALVSYGKAVTVAGYLTSGGEPVAGATVTLRETQGGVTRDRGTAATDDHGYYQKAVAPRSNASWGAAAAGASSTQIVIRVMPRVTLALSHVKSGTRFTEVFSGVVTPKHAGKRMLIQRSTAAGWRTVASGRLDRRSRFSIRWLLPFRTATYKLRAVVPAHADHAEGVSQTATVRVKIRQR